MHELGIISAIATTVLDIMEKEGLSSVEKIVLQVGELSGVLPHYVEECYPAAVYKTPLEKTKLEMEIIPGTVRCNQCGEEFNAVLHDLRCPKCRSENLEALTGRELIIKEILAE